MDDQTAVFRVDGATVGADSAGWIVSAEHLANSLRASLLRHWSGSSTDAPLVASFGNLSRTAVGP